MLKSFGWNNEQREDERERALKVQEVRSKRDREEQEVAKRQDIMRLYTVLKVVRPFIPLHIWCKVLICHRISS